jgi:hypothetical protein
MESKDNSNGKRNADFNESSEEYEDQNYSEHDSDW